MRFGFQFTLLLLILILTCNAQRSDVYTYIEIEIYTFQAVECQETGAMEDNCIILGNTDPLEIPESEEFTVKIIDQLDDLIKMEVSYKDKTVALSEAAQNPENQFDFNIFLKMLDYQQLANELDDEPLDEFSSHEELVVYEDISFYRITYSAVQIFQEGTPHESRIEFSLEQTFSKANYVMQSYNFNILYLDHEPEEPVLHITTFEQVDKDTTPSVASLSPWILIPTFICMGIVRTILKGNHLCEL